MLRGISGMLRRYVCDVERNKWNVEEVCYGMLKGCKWDAEEVHV
jgi:hypothetical protein